MKMSWNCTQCSFLNHPDLGICEMCDSVKVSHNANSTITAVAPLTIKLAQNCKENETVHDTLIHADQQCKVVMCSNATADILELISNFRSKNMKTPPVYRLCSPHCLHVSQRGAYGSAWSCGYRNIQMLCSSLMQMKEYADVLFKGSRKVPEIKEIQHWIETAWNAGFDVEVSEYFVMTFDVVYACIFRVPVIAAGTHNSAVLLWYYVHFCCGAQNIP